MQCSLLLTTNQFHYFLENLAKAGKAIQAILDATGKNKGKIMDIILLLLFIVVVVVVVFFLVILLLLLFTSEIYRVEY